MPDNPDPDEYGDVDPADIDSKCFAPPLGAEGPTEAKCGADAVTYAFRNKGHRTYLCADHARQLLRFGDGVFDDGFPTVVTCERCFKPTPKAHINFDKVCEDCQV